MNLANPDGADILSYEFVRISASETISTMASREAYSFLPDRRPYEQFLRGQIQIKYATARNTS